MNYRVKVKKTTYLWGGTGVKRNIESDIFFCFRVDDEGEQIKFGVLQKNGEIAEFGQLEPGECYTVRLKDILGIYATCPDPEDTNVDCYILGNPSS